MMTSKSKTLISKSRTQHLLKIARYLNFPPVRSFVRHYTCFSILGGEGILLSGSFHFHFFFLFFKYSKHFNVTIKAYTIRRKFATLLVLPIQKIIATPSVCNKNIAFEIITISQETTT